MNKQQTLNLLMEIRIHQRDNIPYYDGNVDYMDFITVYYNIGKKKNLNWCNTVKDAQEVVNKLTNKHKIAIEINDEFYETGYERYD